MSRLLRNMMMLSAGALALLATAGCANGPVSEGHRVAVDNARQRWLTMRTGHMVQTAQRQFDAGELELAERTVSEALSQDPGNAELYVLAGRITLEHGQLERSLLLLNRAVELDAKLAAGHYCLGVVHQRLQEHDKALACYQRAAAVVTDNPAYLLAASEMLMALDRDQEALDGLTAQLRVFDQNAGVRLAIAQIHILHGRYPQAVEMYQKAALLRPNDLQIVEDLAGAQLAAGLTREAIANYQRLLALKGYEERRDLQRALANAYLAAERRSDAKAVYLRLMRADPRDAEVWIKLGETCWALEDDAGALSATQKVMALEPRRHEGFLLAGMVHQKRGQVAEALWHFDQAAALAPTLAAPLVLRGLTLQQAGQPKPAAVAYAEALKREPQDTRAQRLLAQLSTHPQP